MQLLITGAAGFVGQHLGTAAVRQGFKVKGVTRRLAAALPAGVCPVHLAALDQADALEAACNGCDAMVHLAARVHVMRDRASDPSAEFRRANVDVTRRILDAAVRAGVRRFIFLSTVKVYGDVSERPLTETDAPRPADPYSLSKLEAEGLVTSRSGELEPVVLRPPLVYGPGVGGNFRQLLALAEWSRRIPLPLGSIQNRRSLVYVGNLVHAILHLLACPDVAGRTFLVSDGEDLSTPELVRRIVETSGARAKLMRVSPSILRIAGQLPGMRQRVQRLMDSLVVDIGAIRRSGWSPPYSVNTGLQATVKWWHAEART